MRRNPALRKWKPDEDQKSPLKSPGDEYDEIEAAFEWGVPLDRWCGIHPMHRAKMLAYSLHRRLAENFEMSRIRKKGEKSEHKGFSRLLDAMQ